MTVSKVMVTVIVRSKLIAGRPNPEPEERSGNTEAGNRESVNFRSSSLLRMTEVPTELVLGQIL